jgi:ribokinase
MLEERVDYAVVGGLREDYFITPSGEVHLRKIGGNAVYAAVGARLWSERVGVLSRVGDNYPAEWLEVIGRRGINTRGVKVLDEPLDTRTFYAYLTREVRDDTQPERHFARVGQPVPAGLIGYATSTEGQADPDTYSRLAVRPEEVPLTYLAARGVHLAPYDFALHRKLPALLRAEHVRYVTCDPSIRYMQPEFEAEVRDIVAGLDAFLPSEMETRSFFGERLADLWQAVEAFGAMGAGCVVLKLGAQGQYVYEPGARRRWHVPAYPARVADVTGAGDSYCGGFLVGLGETGDPLEAALRGTVAASLVVEGFGALYALEHGPAHAQARLQELRAMVKKA